MKQFGLQVYFLKNSLTQYQAFKNTTVIKYAASNFDTYKFAVSATLPA